MSNNLTHTNVWLCQPDPEGVVSIEGYEEKYKRVRLYSMPTDMEKVKKYVVADQKRYGFKFTCACKHTSHEVIPVMGKKQQPHFRTTVKDEGESKCPLSINLMVKEAKNLHRIITGLSCDMVDTEILERYSKATMLKRVCTECGDPTCDSQWEIPELP